MGLFANVEARLCVGIPVVVMSDLQDTEFGSDDTDDNSASAETARVFVSACPALHRSRSTPATRMILDQRGTSWI